jgi:hypothetical protein
MEVGFSSTPSLLLGRLGVRLVVTSDTISHHGESKVFKDVSLLGSQFQEASGQPVIVLSLTSEEDPEEG